MALRGFALRKVCPASVQWTGAASLDPPVGGLARLFSAGLACDWFFNENLNRVLAGQAVPRFLVNRKARRCDKRVARDVWVHNTQRAEVALNLHKRTFQRNFQLFA